MHGLNCSKLARVQILLSYWRSMQVTHYLLVRNLPVCQIPFLSDRVKRFVLSYRTVVCPVSVCPVSGVGVLWQNGWIDQDGTWHGGRPRPKPHCVRWEPSSPTPKGGTSAAHFSAHVYCGQTVAHLSYCWGCHKCKSIPLFGIYYTA